MRYRVSVHQDLKYNDTVIGTFDNLALVQHFIEMVMKYFPQVDVTIEVLMEEELPEEEE